MQYTIVHLCFNTEKDFISDVLASHLGEVGFDSFVETDKGLDAYIPSAQFDENTLKNQLAEFPFDESITYEIEVPEEKNWNEEWEKHFFEPIVISDKCVIHSSFHKDYPACEYDIVINPQMAFGTGHHETTGLMISEILKMDLTNKTVLDMGCGTSVLAILAEKRGAKAVIAIDIDDWCVRNSEENIRLNNAQNIHVMLGGAELLKGKKFDIVIANINRNILLADMEAYAACLPVGGELYMSGFYTEDVPILEKKANELGLKLQYFNQKNNWAAVKMC